MSPYRGRNRGIPAFIWGRRALSTGPQHTLVFPTGRSLNVERLEATGVKAILDGRQRPIADLRTHEIVDFLYAVGQNWKQPDFPIRASYERNLIDYLGFSPAAAENEANWVAFLLASSRNLYDALDAEFGSWRVFDAWTDRGETAVRAFPLGLTLHVLPGNVPLSGVVSLLRGLVTRNACVLKTSGGDPFTATALIQSFAEADTEHPVTRSVSTVYWPRESADDHGATLAAAADALVLWGDREAIAWGRRHAGDRAEVIAFGPKRSFSIVGPGADLEAAAKGVAFDAALYDQRACFSAREVFVHAASVEAFAPKLAQALEALEAILPAGARGLDEAADQTLRRAHWDFLDQLRAGGARWSIVQGQDAHSGGHGLGRTLFIRPFDRFEEIWPSLDSDVQTVGVAPWSLSAQIRDPLAARGVSRIVDCGFHNVFRVGGAHDGHDGLRRLARLANVELPAAIHVRGVHLAIDQTDIVANRKFADFIP